MIAYDTDFLLNDEESMNDLKNMILKNPDVDVQSLGFEVHREEVYLNVRVKGEKKIVDELVEKYFPA